MDIFLEIEGMQWKIESFASNYSSSKVHMYFFTTIGHAILLKYNVGGCQTE